MDWSIQRDESSDIPGLFSIIAGILALLCLFGVCFTCGLSTYVGVPMALVGLLCGYWAKGVYRTIGLAMNLIAFVPSVAIGAYLTYALVRGKSPETFQRQARSPFSQEVPAAPPLYQTLYHKETPGCAFHFRWGEHNYIACSLTQFNHRPPDKLYSYAFPDPVPVQQVHKQQQLQVLSYRSEKLDKITPLAYAGDPHLSIGDSVQVQLKDRVVTGEITETSRNGVSIWTAEFDDDLGIGSSSGAPVLNAHGDKVVGVAIGSNRAGDQNQILFEPLKLPDSLR